MFWRTSQPPTSSTSSTAAAMPMRAGVKGEGDAGGASRFGAAPGAGLAM
jgi:hypothetical protein